MSFVEEIGDLFDLDNKWALAHCVGSDLIMGKGIAIQFKNKFGHVDFLLSKKATVGETILLNSSFVGQNIFYMVTKKWSRKSKPTYDDIEKCIIDMFQKAIENEIHQIGMPKIGCGLDGKKWDIVKSLILKHQPTNISIKIRYLQ